MSVPCGHPTPTGPCRRPVTRPGERCGAAHPDASSSEHPAHPAHHGPPADPLHPSDTHPTPAGIARGALGADAVYLIDQGSPLGRVEAPVPERTEVITDDNGQVTIDRIAVCWEDLGEGFGGDYDPEDPDDERLLRFALEVRHAGSGEWDPQWSDGYCTSVGADADEQTRAGGLAHIARLVRLAAVTGQGTSTAAANASWITTEQAAAAADRFAAADPDADAGLLDRLAGHPDPEVRAAAAANPNCRPAARAHAGLLAD